MTTPPRHQWNPAATDEPSHLRRNVLVGMSTLSAVVLAMAYHTSLDAQSAAAPAVATATATRAVTGTAAGSGNGAASGTGSSAGSGSSTGSSGGSSAGTSAGSSGALKDGTYTGTVTPTRWGNVQVRIVVAGGRITGSTAVQYPTENSKDVQINSRAVPSYNAAAVAAQSADIDAISGATVTWQGYTSSLQSAIDQARA